ncbi:MAG TPA: FHA domain-containing protein, partial [Vicinamibacteria bacterium]|nr:FHA domain-containing protein [Vicinamibacteria bacterium]
KPPVPPPPPPTSRPTGPASAAPAPPSASLTPAAPKLVFSPAVATAGPIAEVRLTGVETDLLISLPGRHEVGRAHEVSLRVYSPTVSRRHAVIVLSDDRTAVHVEHLGGSNGTYLNGVELAIMKPTPVVDGDVVRFGDLELKIGLKRL